jgi:hypothetical protein
MDIGKAPVCTPAHVANPLSQKCHGNAVACLIGATIVTGMCLMARPSGRRNPADRHDPAD